MAFFPRSDIDPQFSTGQDGTSGTEQKSIGSFSLPESFSGIVDVTFSAMGTKQDDGSVHFWTGHYGVFVVHDGAGHLEIDDVQGGLERKAALLDGATFEPKLNGSEVYVKVVGVPGFDINWTLKIAPRGRITD